ncbi:MAG TPA: hypothetical protein VFY87_09110, partial [Geminicoccaceae bacterium]|nr:hypothetical protein [Geminicoccaceae bacterium]
MPRTKGGAAPLGARPDPAVVLAGAVLFLWPTALNWHPYLFWDTYGYFLQGKAYAQLILGWLQLAPAPPETAHGWIGAAGRMLAADPSIRSPTWSLLCYSLAALGGFWPLAALNALAAAAVVELALLRLFGLAPKHRLAVMAGMAIFTSLPWFASYLMPDLYAGLLVLAAATLAFAWRNLGGAERAGLSALYLLSVSFHTSHLPLAAGLAALAALLPAEGDRRLARALRLGLPVAAAVVLLLGANWLAFGHATLSPQGAPFLLARSWEDGPARAYLEATCPEAGWAVCAGLDALPDTAQGFLWAPERSYWGMSLAARAAVRAEETAILAQAIAADPLGQLRASLANAAEQLGSFGLDDLVLGRGAVVSAEDYTFVYLPEAPAAVWGLSLFSALVYAGAALALLALAGLLAGPGARAGAPVAAFVLAALLLNAVVCGALSGPHHRYQARVVWLLPLLAAGLLLRPREAVTAAPRVPAPAAP